MSNNIVVYFYHQIQSYALMKHFITDYLQEILTAAHCTAGKSPADFVVLVSYLTYLYFTISEKILYIINLFFTTESKDNHFWIFYFLSPKHEKKKQSIMPNRTITITHVPGCFFVRTNPNHLYYYRLEATICGVHLLVMRLLYVQSMIILVMIQLLLTMTTQF